MPERPRAELEQPPRPGDAVRPAPGIAVINGSTVVDHDDADRMTEACAEQMLEFCGDWSRLPIGVVFYEKPGDVPAGMPTIVLVDDAKEDGALAFHTESTKGLITGMVDAGACLNAGGGVLAGSPSISSALSHELLEAAVDPNVNLWCDMPDGRQAVAREVCDPCQDVSYTIDGVDVSDYVLPSWFDWASKAEKYTRCGSLKRPFTRTAGGYFVLRADGVTHQEGERPVYKGDTGRGALRLASGRKAEELPGQLMQALDKGTLDAIRAQSHEHGGGVAQIVADVIQRARAKIVSGGSGNGPTTDAPG